MKERPIIMRGEGVRAILEGRKSQTRRVCKPEHFHGSELPPDSALRRAMEFGSRSPYGVPGDRLWVRETWSASPVLSWGSEHSNFLSVKYRAGGCEDKQPEMWSLAPARGEWRPSIHMPRWASRLTLEIKAVRVERLQEISEEDARAEGVIPLQMDHGLYRPSFEGLWDSINAKRGYGWDANPWVWVVEFERVEDA